MHDARLAGALGLAPEQREHTEAVLRRICWERGIQQIGAGRQQIGMADELIGAAPRRRLPRPTHDQRHAMAPFVEICLIAAQAGAWIVAEGLKRRQVCGGRKTVVGGEDHQRVRGETRALEHVE